MGKSVNQVTLMGNLVRDPEVRATSTGKNVANFTLAVGKRSGEGAYFFDVTVWEKLADLVVQYTRKGSKVLVLGSLDQQAWEQDGQKRTKITVVATDVSFLDSRQDTVQSVQPTSSVTTNDQPINLDDIPF